MDFRDLPNLKKKNAAEPNLQLFSAAHYDINMLASRINATKLAKFNALSLKKNQKTAV